MTKRRNLRKNIALVVMWAMLIQVVSSGIALAGDGPAQPEAAQFEPVDVTDVVSLSTGDFTYTIPLLEVEVNASARVGALYPVPNDDLIIRLFRSL